MAENARGRNRPSRLMRISHRMWSICDSEPLEVLCPGESAACVCGLACYPVSRGASLHSYLAVRSGKLSEWWHPYFRQRKRHPLLVTGVPRNFRWAANKHTPKSAPEWLNIRPPA